jgi:uncharacterized protein (DUF2141 family)
MKTLISYIVYLALGLTTILAQETTQEITVDVENIKNDKGMLYIALYDSEANFLENGFKYDKGTIKDGKMTAKFSNVPTGVYAVSLYHDANGNKKLDMNFLGIPKESTACSNNAKGFMGPPKWEDAKFEVKEQPVRITIKM